MPTIGIISCQVFEREIACLLASDCEVNSITIIEDSASAYIIQELESEDIERVNVIPHLSSYRKEHSLDLDVLIRIMKLSLHTRKKTLQRALEEAIRVMSSKVDAMLLIYGLCGGVLDNIRQYLRNDIPVYIPERNGKPAEDCVGLMLGGNECYYEEQRKEPGTFFMTPGWATHWEDVLGKQANENANDSLRLVYRNYKRCLLIPTQAMSEVELRNKTSDFIDALGLSVEVREGSMNLISDAWHRAKASVMGNRDENS